MNLYARLESEMKAAMKEGQAVKLSALRMLITACRKSQMDKNSKSIEDADVIQALSRQIKQHKESIDQFKAGNRVDLAEKEACELKILEMYMPEQTSPAELEAIINSAIAETGATNKSDMGKVMKLVNEKAKGRCDGKTVSQMVMKILQ